MTIEKVEWVNVISDAEFKKILAERERTQLTQIFPKDDKSKAGKDIAALASAGGGFILFGVTNDGHPVGLSDVQSERQRDEIRLDVENIARDSVKPEPRIDFNYFEGEKGEIIIAIITPRQEIVHHYKERPCYRNGTSSEFASPEKVREITLGFDVARIVNRFKNSLPTEQSVAAGFIGQSQLATMSYQDLKKLLETDYKILRETI